MIAVRLKVRALLGRQAVEFEKDLQLSQPPYVWLPLTEGRLGERVPIFRQRQGRGRPGRRPSQRRGGGRGVRAGGVARGGARQPARLPAEEAAEVRVMSQRSCAGAVT